MSDAEKTLRALLGYVLHKPGCGVMGAQNHVQWRTGDEDECTCGLAALLPSLPSEEEGPLTPLHHIDAELADRLEHDDGFRRRFAGKLAQSFREVPEAAPGPTPPRDECAGPFVSAFDCPVHDPRKAQAPAEAVTGWQPFETAPRDGSLIWMLSPKTDTNKSERISIGNWDNRMNMWFVGLGWYPPNALTERHLFPFWQPFTGKKPVVPEGLRRVTVREGAGTPKPPA